MSAPIDERSAAEHLWDALLARLTYSTDVTELVALLTLLGEMPTEHLPIGALTDMYLRLAQHSDETLDLTFTDLDDELLKPCRVVIEGAGEAVPLTSLVAVIRTLYATDDGDDQMQERLHDLLACLKDLPLDVTPFTDLLHDASVSIRLGALDALFYLGRSDGMVAALNDEEARVRALAIENLGCLHQLPIAEVTMLAAHDPDEEVREAAREHLEKATALAQA